MWLFRNILEMTVWKKKMIEVIDIHSHIIPGVDDGSKDMNMTRDMLRLAWKEGIRVIVATPHYKCDGMCKKSFEFREYYEKVCQEARKIHPDFAVFLGNELMDSHSLCEELEAGKALTMAGSNYVLLEFAPSVDACTMKHSLQRMQMHGYWPVIAHAERYECMRSSLELTETLVAMGCYIQVNAGSIMGKNGFRVKGYVKKILSRELVHFLGTDAHDMEKRKPEIQRSAACISDRYGAEYTARIVWENPCQLLARKKI